MKCRKAHGPNGRFIEFFIAINPTQRHLIKLILRNQTLQLTIVMKTKTTFARAAALSVIVALVSPLAYGQGKGKGNAANNTTNNSGNNDTSANSNQVLPVIPIGWIDAYPTVVQTGTHPTISWGINYPSQVNELITVVDDGTLVAKEEICVECRVLGAGVTAVWSNGHWQFVPTEALISYNGASYERVFYGTNDNVNPGNVVWQRCEMQQNQTLRFGGRYFWNNNWGPFFHSTDNTTNVRILTNGQEPPSFSNIHPDIPTIDDFIRPYLDNNGRIKIGPQDVIILMELTHTYAQKEHEGYDFQDMVLICNVKPKPKNNNRSGLGDGTNPGKGNQMGNNDGTNNPNNAPHSGGSN